MLIERLLFKPLAKAPVLTNVVGFIALFAIVNSVAGLIWDFTIKSSEPVRIVAFLGSQLISTHQAGMIGVTVVLLVCSTCSSSSPGSASRCAPPPRSRNRRGWSASRVAG